MMTPCRACQGQGISMTAIQPFPGYIQQVNYMKSVKNKFVTSIEYEIFGEGSHIATNQKRENSAFSPLIS